jgi:hypothetical protein
MELFLYLLKYSFKVMDIFSFSLHFTDEESRVLHYKGQRDKQGKTVAR